MPAWTCTIIGGASAARAAARPIAAARAWSAAWASSCTSASPRARGRGAPRAGRAPTPRTYAICNAWALCRCPPDAHASWRGFCVLFIAKKEDPHGARHLGAEPSLPASAPHDAQLLDFSWQDSCMMLQDEEILTEGSEVERPVGMGEGTSEIGSERRYATRQSTRKQTSQAATIEPEKVTPLLYLQSLIALACNSISFFLYPESQQLSGHLVPAHDAPSTRLASIWDNQHHRLQLRC